MGELLVHHMYNQVTRKSDMLVRDTGPIWNKPHSVRLNGRSRMRFKEGYRRAIILYPDYNMKVVGSINGTDTELSPLVLVLLPGQQVTLQFKGGHVLHTLSYLPTDANEAINAVERAQVKRARQH